MRSNTIRMVRMTTRSLRSSPIILDTFCRVRNKRHEQQNALGLLEVISMKRLLVILIMLGLILTGCAGIKETTKGEESPEEVITQQETKEPVESETTET